MRWFRKHTNWTYLIGYMALLLPIIYFAAWLPGFYLVVFLLGIVGLSVWILKVKNRSLWNLLWFLVGLGPIPLLILRSKDDGLEIDRLVSRELKRREIDKVKNN